MNIDGVIEMMEELLDNSSAVPFSNKKVIDCEQMRDYIDQLRLNLPKEIEEAKKTMEDRAKIISEANEEAEEIKKKAEEAIELAKQKVIEMVSETEITKQAKEYAAELITKAQGEADDIVAQARAKDAEIKRAMNESVSKTLLEAKDILGKNLEDVTGMIEAFEKLSAAPEETTAE